MASLWYTNKLVRKLAVEERKKAELLAEAFTRIVNADRNDPDLGFYSQIIADNETVPVIVVDSLDVVFFHRNLDSLKMLNINYVRRKLGQMKDNNDPIIINLSPADKQYLFYGKSSILIQLTYYPYIQLIIILLFISLAYFAFSTSRKAEQNQVWVGLSKETAHQLGTPISSLLAWFEVMKSRMENESLLFELEKDVKRLETITERFSKIGSTPVLIHENISNIVLSAVRYLQSRLSEKVIFNLDIPSEEILVPVNKSLFEWVVENLCKNAVDALNGIGEITISIKDFTQVVYIDIADTGKGIQKSMFRTIFKPGFTTKQTGWGLGLSLAKRIVEEYHDGKIFVHQSEINRGTVFRIVLKKRRMNS
ncbi:MAG: HAMP domain-containing histidine kinase [Bacteroidales bacterium]|nr:HAMP domain-containing histidine kinase [Bacteroidales bacterium]